MLAGLAVDCRAALRSLRRSPAFTASAILILGLGAGTAATVFTAVDAAFFRPLPFRQPDELVALANVDLPYDFHLGVRPARASLADVARLPVFSQVAAAAVGGLTLEVADLRARVRTAYVTRAFFQTLGRFPALGRAFDADEANGVGQHVAILSHRIRQRIFGRDTAVIGRTLMLNGRSYRVVGVMPADFAYPADPDLWLPLPMPISGVEIFEAFKLYIPATIIARTAPGQTTASAGEALKALERQFPVWKYMSDSSALDLVQPLQQSFMRPDTHRALVMLIVSAVLIASIAAGNLAGLLLARVHSQQDRTSIQRMLGAPTRRVVQAVAVEATMLIAAGIAAGLACAVGLKRFLVFLLPPALMAISPPQIDGRAVLASVAVAMLVGGLATAWAALAAVRAGAGALGGGHATETRRALTTRGTLVAGQLALAVMLLVGAGLLIRSAQSLVRNGAILSADDVWTAQLTLPRAAYPSGGTMASFYRSALARLQGQPDVRAAGLIDVLPLSGQAAPGAAVASEDDPSTTITPLSYLVSPGYFAAMGIPIERGRGFTSSDDAKSHIVIVNRSLARFLWGEGDPIGRRVLIDGERHTVVGLIQDLMAFSLTDSSERQIYQPLVGYPVRSATFVIRGTSGPGVIRALDDAVRGVDAHQVAYGARRMSDVVTQSIAAPRARARLLALFAGLAVVLTTTGVYGLLAYTLQLRRRDLGIRIAIGATAGNVVRLMLGQTLLLVGAGLGIGTLGALALSNGIASLLYGVNAHDALTFGSVVAIVLATTCVATVVPILGALRSNPVDVLRAE